MSITSQRQASTRSISETRRAIEQLRGRIKANVTMCEESRSAISESYKTLAEADWVHPDCLAGQRRLRR